MVREENIKKIKLLSRKNPFSLTFKPVIFNFKNSNHLKKVNQLIKSKKILNIVDEFNCQNKELQEVKNPKLIFQTHKLSKTESGGESFYRGKWIYYPWKYSLVHVLNKQEFSAIRESRNQNLITKNEQKKLEKIRIGIVGLNVGNPAAICLALEGIGKEMKFADNDILSLSNLNRFRAGISDIGLNKAILSARQVYEINPFIKISVFPRGIKPENINKFLTAPRINILVEEMDNLSLKVKIREQARKFRIPVIMVTGNGENVIIDIERFDFEPKLPLLSGHLKQNIIETIKSEKIHNLPPQKKILLARDFMGAKYLNNRLKKSFLEVGSKIAGIPQLSESSFLRGAAICHFIRRITLGEKIFSGRYNLKLDKIRIIKN